MADRRRGQGSLARAGCTPRGAARRPPPCRASPVAAGRPATLPAGAADRKGRWRSLVHREMLHPIRGGVPGLLGNRPAVLAGQVRKQPAHERLGAPAKLHPGEPAGDPAHHLVEQLLPAGRVDRYAVACGHRLMLGSHTTASSTVAALVRSSTPSLSSQVTIYGWSTSQPLAAGRACPARQPLRSVRSSLRTQARPCGRPPAAAVLGRQA
jgi:hypothetical protein